MWVKIVKTHYAQAKRVWPTLSVKKKANEICQIYLATVQTNQHKDSSVSSVTFGSFLKTHVTF